MDDMAKPKRESTTEMNELVLPSDANVLGTAFGGRVMQWIDICAGMAAVRHARKAMVTASMDELHFHAPIRVGEMACLIARVNATFAHSLEVGVEVVSENAITGEKRHCCSALLTFTAVTPDGRPDTVPPLLLETQEDRDEQEAAAARRQHRLAHRRRTRPGIPG
jgi:acyl-CoA hydrolase